MTAEEKLIAERERIVARQRRRKQQAEADRQRFYEIERKLEKLQLSKLVGIDAGVKINVRYEAGHPEATFNQARGTLVKVNRTRALVDFGELGRWTWPIHRLVAADGRQGVTMEALAAGDMGDVA